MTQAVLQDSRASWQEDAAILCRSCKGMPYADGAPRLRRPKLLFRTEEAP
jgi:hypothetical protein